jgi:hypothetical protein
METFEIFNQPIFEEEIYHDFERHIEELVINRFEKYNKELEGKNLYYLKITKIPSRINYHTFDYEKLNDISRKLVNGMTSLGSIPNRKFWNKYFQGGVRTTSIIQEESFEFPSFNLNYIVYSEHDNLDVRIKSQLSTRIKMIDPTLKSNFEYMGTFDITKIKDYLDSSTKVEFDSLPVDKLGQRNLDLMVFNPLQRPRFIGGLFKPNRDLVNKN